MSIYVHIWTDIYVTYMSVTHNYYMSSTHYKIKYMILYCGQIMMSPIFHIIILTYMSHIVFFRKGTFEVYILFNAHFHHPQNMLSTISKEDDLVYLYAKDNSVDFSCNRSFVLKIPSCL